MTCDYLATTQTRLVKLQLIPHLPFIIYIYPQSWTLPCLHNWLSLHSFYLYLDLGGTGGGELVL